MASPDTSPSSKIVAVVLAGGLARRLGGEKALRPLGDRALLDRVLSRVRPQVDAVAVNSNADPSAFAAWDVDVVADPVAGHPGPLAGVLAGLAWIATRHPDAQALLSVPVDTPFLPRDLAVRLRAACLSARAEAAVAVSGGRRHPVVALWPASGAASVRVALESGRGRVEAALAQFRVAEAVFGHEPRDPFFNVNTPEDAAVAERWIAEINGAS